MCKQVDEVEQTPEEKFVTPLGLPDPGPPAPAPEKPLYPPTKQTIYAYRMTNPLEGKDEFEEIELSVVSD